MQHALTPTGPCSKLEPALDGLAACPDACLPAHKPHTLTQGVCSRQPGPEPSGRFPSHLGSPPQQQEFRQDSGSRPVPYSQPQGPAKGPGSQAPVAQAHSPHIRWAHSCQGPASMTAELSWQSAPGGQHHAAYRREWRGSGLAGMWAASAANLSPLEPTGLDRSVLR